MIAVVAAVAVDLETRLRLMRTPNDLAIKNTPIFTGQSLPDASVTKPWAELAVDARHNLFEYRDSLGRPWSESCTNGTSLYTQPLVVRRGVAAYTPDSRWPGPRVTDNQRRSTIYNIPDGRTPSGTDTSVEGAGSIEKPYQLRCCTLQKHQKHVRVCDSAQCTSIATCAESMGYTNQSIMMNGKRHLKYDINDSNPD